MRCPYCKSAAPPAVPACQQCGMSLEKISRLFGAVPRLVGGISDDAGILSDAAKRRVKAAARELSIRFPQTKFSVVTSKLAQHTSLSVFSFWIFNEARITRDVDREWNNYDILLCLDPGHGRSSLMIGYGLEVFVSESHLDAILSGARQFFEEGNFGSGIERIIERTYDTLSHIFSNLEETHGLAPIVSAKAAEIEVAPTEF